MCLTHPVVNLRLKNWCFTSNRVKREDYVSLYCHIKYELTYWPTLHDHFTFIFRVIWHWYLWYIELEWCDGNLVLFALQELREKNSSVLRAYQDIENKLQAKEQVSNCYPLLHCFSYTVRLRQIIRISLSCVRVARELPITHGAGMYSLNLCHSILFICR